VRWLKLIGVMMPPLLIVSLASPAWAANSTFHDSWSGNTPGSNPKPPAYIPGTPPKNGTPPSSKCVSGCHAPQGCGAIWATYSGENHLIAWCQGGNAAQNINYYSSHKPSCTPPDTCAVIVPIKGTPAQNGTPALKKNPYSGIPSELLTVFDNLTVPTPTIAGMRPSPTTPGPQGQPPYLYTRLPTQVAVVPSSVPPTLTSSHTTTSVGTVDTTWNAQLNKWNTKTVTTTLTASITATFAGVLWVPEAADVNGSLNIATPSGETGPTTGVIMCNPNQNNLSYNLNNDLPNPNFCFIDFVQPSNLSGYYVHAYAAYTATGTITENGAKIWSGFLGEKYSAVPASQQVIVAVIESVGCSTQKCKNAGLAPSNQVISPLPEYTPGG